MNYLGTSEKMPRKGKEHLHDVHRKENLHDMPKFTCHRSLLFCIMLMTVMDQTVVSLKYASFIQNVKIQKFDDTHFLLKTNAVVSDGLTKWVLQFGEKIKVKSPNDLIYEVKKKAQEIISLY